MTNLNLATAVLAEEETLPPFQGLKQYVVAGNGLWIRAEDSRLAALVPVTFARTYGLVDLETRVELKVPRIPGAYLDAVLQSARRHLPHEAMYQYTYREDPPGWRCAMPPQTVQEMHVDFADNGETIVDLHSHASLKAFFSATDDRDEMGFRLYVVIGRVDTEAPELLCRVGVYGHHAYVPAETIFEDVGPFVEIDPEEELKAELAEDLQALDETDGGV